MKTQYEIRNSRLDGIFIGFDTEWEAMRYWRENCERAPETNLMHGAVVVRHSWETKSEAETARLDWLLGAGSLAALMAECDRAPALYTNPATWLQAARTAIDICRKSPPTTSVVIWPKDVKEGSRSSAIPVCPSCKSQRWAEIHPSKTDPTGLTLYCRRCEEGCVSPLILENTEAR